MALMTLGTCFGLPWSTLICLGLRGLFQITIERLKCSKAISGIGFEISVGTDSKSTACGANKVYWWFFWKLHWETLITGGHARVTFEGRLMIVNKWNAGEEGGSTSRTWIHTLGDQWIQTIFPQCIDPSVWSSTGFKRKETKLPSKGQIQSRVGGNAMF